MQWRRQLVMLMISAAGWWASVSYAQPRFPLKVAGSGRYLMDQSGQPFLIHGDAAWGLPVMLTREEAGLYLANRQTNGFNAAIMMLIANHPSLHDRATTNCYGNAPFLGASDFSRPNESYFAHVDWVVKEAEKRGILVILAPCYIGFMEKDEWQQTIVANGLNKCRAYGRFLGARYRDSGNILWLHFGDNGDMKYLPYVREIARGIREEAPAHLHTAKLWPEQSSRDFLSGESWVDVNAAYAYGSLWNYKRKVYDKVLEDYNRMPAAPVLLIESTYEGEHDSATQWIRRQAYWALLSGAAGHCMGSYPIWAFAKGWAPALDGAASRSMVHLKHLFDSRPWHLLVPDQRHSVVIAGYGRWKSDEYIVAARSSDRTTALAYLPVGCPLRISLSSVSGENANVWWFNPRDGSNLKIGEFAASGARMVAPSDENDWILVIDSASQGYRPPGKLADLP